MDKDILPSERVTPPPLSQSWRAIPHVGFQFDRVIVLSHKPAHPVLSAVWRSLTLMPDFCETKIFDLFERAITKMESEKPAEPVRHFLKQHLTNSFMALTKKVPMDKVFGTIRDDYGHMSTIYRRNGVPIVLEEGARVVGFYPDFLAKIRAGNEMRFLDDTLSNADRAAKMLRYDRPFEGALGNDEEVDVSSCAIVKIGQAQFVKARKALQRRAAYHSFARKGLNCATHHYTSADAIGSPTPPVLRHALPNYVAHAIERLVEKRGPVVSEGGGAYPLRIAAGHAGGQRSTGRRSGRTALV